MHMVTEAIRWYHAGEPPKGATSIAGRPSYGYGVLDDYGFWEYQLPARFIEGRRNKKHLVYLIQLKVAGKHMPKLETTPALLAFLQRVSASHLLDSCRVWKGVFRATLGAWQ